MYNENSHAKLPIKTLSANDWSAFSNKGNPISPLMYYLQPLFIFTF